MKIREVLQLTDRHLPGTTQSITADETTTRVAPVQIPNRLVGPQERPGLSDIFPDADPDDRMAGDPSPTSLAPVSMPHTPDLDFIKAQIARLPRR